MTISNSTQPKNKKKLLCKEAYKSDIGSAQLGALDVKVEGEPYQYHTLSTSSGMSSF